jgi:trans-2,3-dihydro-3-hydroxyanthranilate isomerase
MTEKRRFPFYQVDAFTTTPLTGNACAVVLDADGLDEAAMLAIAREMNLSETAFVFPSSAADFGVRYFTPAEEIPMAGHPTLATTYALVEAGQFNLRGTRTTLTLEMPAGVLPWKLSPGSRGWNGW